VRQHPYAMRTMIVAAFMALLGFAILVQIVRIQASDEVKTIVDQGMEVFKDFYPPRGEIYDRNGNLLAGNKTVYEIGLDRTSDPDMGTVMQALQMSGFNLEEVNFRLSQAPDTAQYIILDDFVTVDNAKKLMELQDIATVTPPEKTWTPFISRSIMPAVTPKTTWLPPYLVM
jgi:cell division protein FtsI/penicillin-binding protein 2